MTNSLPIRRAAVLGAGVMGAQIAAHLTNAGVDTVLFDLPAKEGAADGIVLKVGGGVALLFSILFMLFEMFIGALQAYIFTILTAQYISSSISESH